MSCAQAHWIVSKPTRRIMQLKLHKPAMAIGYTHCACAHDMSIRPIEIEVTLHLGQNRYRKPRCRIGLYQWRAIVLFSVFNQCFRLEFLKKDSTLMYMARINSILFTYLGLYRNTAPLAVKTNQRRPPVL